MKSVILATSLMAVLASSNPLDKRYYVTETDIYTVTVTETGWGAKATGGWGGWGNWGQWSTSADPTTPTATSDAWVASSYSTPAAATTTAAAAWSSAPAAPSGGSVSSYAQAILDQHNNHRSNHSANPLVWDNDLANTAQTIGQSCVYAHDT